MIPREPLSVSANLTRSSPHAPESRAEVTLTTRLGLCCQLDIARVRTQRVTYVEIVGTKGRVRADWTSGKIQTFQKETLPSQEFVLSTPTIVWMLKDFFQALRTNQPMPITGEEGLRALELVEACQQTAHSRKPIQFQDYTL